MSGSTGKQLVLLTQAVHMYFEDKNSNHMHPESLNMRHLDMYDTTHRSSFAQSLADNSVGKK